LQEQERIPARTRYVPEEQAYSAKPSVAA